VRTPAARPKGSVKTDIPTKYQKIEITNSFLLVQKTQPIFNIIKSKNQEILNFETKQGKPDIDIMYT